MATEICAILLECHEGTSDVNATLHTPWLKRLPRPLYKAAAQAWIDKEYPRHLFIEVTANCNLTCSYCPREDRNNHIDYELFKQVVDEATQYGPRSFSLHLFGEPFLYPRWQQAVSYIKYAHPKHTVLLTTNGTTLNARIDDVVQSSIDLILWTWRPEAVFTPETKEKLRKWGKFRVRFIQEITPKEAYAEWADWPNVERRRLHNYGGEVDLSAYTDVTGVRESVASQINSAHVQNATRWPCYHLWLAPAVAWNGDILLCCADSHHKEVLGHFPEMSVHEAWTGEKLKLVRESHMTGNYRGICTNCDVWKQYPDLFFSWQKHASSH